MKIYKYKKETKEFTTQSIATKNPLEKGQYLIPANATSIDLPEPRSGFTRCFDETNNRWEYKKDYRGTVVFDKKDK